MIKKNEKILSNEQIESFNREGVLVVKNFYSEEEVRLVQRGIYDVIGQVMAMNNIDDTREEFTPENFDQKYLYLIEINRALGGIIYDAVKQIPAFVRLVAHPAHEILFSQLRDSALAGIAAGGYGIRIDNPFEDKYRAMWHQEYPAQLRSVDGVVFWSPLISINEDIGPVVFCPGSQAEGPLAVCESDPEKAGRSGAYSLKIHNEDEYISRYKKISPLTNPRDLVLIDFLVLHTSGYNRSVRPRWSMQFRYFNFNEKVGRAHAWKGSYAAGVDFRTIHPELFKS